MIEYVNCVRYIIGSHSAHTSANGEHCGKRAAQTGGDELWCKRGGERGTNHTLLQSMTKDSSFEYL